MRKPSRKTLLILCAAALLPVIAFAIYVGSTARTTWNDIRAFELAADADVAVKYIGPNEDVSYAFGTTVVIRRAKIPLLRSLLGDRPLAGFDKVEAIQLLEAEPACIGELSRFPGLRTLVVMETQISADEWSVAIDGCRDLESVGFVRSGITDEQLCATATLPNLKAVSLMDESRLTDGGLACFAKLPKLKTLILVHAPNVKGSTIGSLKHLEQIELWGAQFGDDVFVPLAERGQLTAVSLWETSVSSQGIESLEQCRKLEKFLAFKMPINKDAVERLAGLPHLKKVSLFGTGLSESESHELYDTFSHCEILIHGEQLEEPLVRE